MILVNPRHLLRVALFAALIWLVALVVYTSAGLMVPASGPVPVVLGVAFIVAIALIAWRTGR